MNISNLLPFHQHMSHRGLLEKNSGVVKKARPARPQPLERAERTEEYCEHGQAVRTQLAAFFNTPIRTFHGIV
jgi:hypothetical protein